MRIPFQTSSPWRTDFWIAWGEELLLMFRWRTSAGELLCRAATGACLIVVVRVRGGPGVVRGRLCKRILWRAQQRSSTLRRRAGQGCSPSGCRWEDEDYSGPRGVAPKFPTAERQGAGSVSELSSCRLPNSASASTLSHRAIPRSRRLQPPRPRLRRRPSKPRKLMAARSPPPGEESGRKWAA